MSVHRVSYMIRKDCGMQLMREELAIFARKRVLMGFGL